MYEDSYKSYQVTFPGKDPHYYLARVWLSFKAMYGANPRDETLQMAAFSSTYLLACIPPPRCARALAIHLLSQERPDVIEKYKELETEFGELFLPVLEAKEKGTVDELYRRYNPES